MVMSLYTLKYKFYKIKDWQTRGLTHMSKKSILDHHLNNLTVFGATKEDFKRALLCMGMVAMLVMCPRLFEQIFVLLSPGGSI